jgi:cell division protein FtsI (penicillin-binding protein 3)
VTAAARLWNRWSRAGGAASSASMAPRWAQAPAAATRARGGAQAIRSVKYSSSPLLASPTPPWRSKFLVALVGIGFLVLVGRAVYVQILGSDFYVRQGEIRFARTLEMPASRGRITDRHGTLLATSVPAPSLWAIPRDLAKEFEAEPGKRRELARALGMTVAELNGRLDDSPTFAWLRRQAEDDVAQKVLALGLKNVYQLREYKRRYPEGEAMAPIIGFTNADEKGQEGVELALEKHLAGRDGSRRVIRDRLNRVVEDVGESVAPVDGQDIALSIDSKVQFFAYQRLRDAVAQHKARAGSAVVLDVQTGEVLAMANYPSADPSNRRALTTGALRNRAVTDTFEPGSTMKPFVVGLALDQRRIRPSTVIATAPGSLVITGARISDAHPHGDLTVEQVIQKSSNVGTVKIAMQLERRDMWQLYSDVGFGQRPVLEFPGTVSGRLRPYKTWRPIEQATMSYGYGLSTSLFQLARAYTVFATDGILPPLALVRSMGDDAPTPPVAGAGVRVMTAETARAVRHMLQMAADEGGTAPKARVEGYTVAGKTGTARKQEGSGYADRKYRAWFVGMAPASSPRIVVAVMVDEPSAGAYFAGEVAAPVFSDIVLQTLRSMGVPHDREVRPNVVAKPLPPVEEST